MSSMTLQDASARAAEIRALYERFEVEHYGRAWSRSDLVLGLLTDVGDLARLTMTVDGIRPGSDDATARLEHEVGDCLWAVLAIARAYGVDIERAFASTMATLADVLDR